MNVGARLKDRLAEIGMSQSELARRVRVNQSTIAGLVAGRSRSSAHLHLIARELATTPEYLTGETDDPDEGAPPPAPAPRHQQVLLSVTLPSEAALAAAFQGVLRASQKMDEAGLARELAKRLPTVLRISASAIVEPASTRDDDLPEPDAPPADAPRARRRA
ncbi:helix-turn-helix domain-containing protein [Sphingomonas bacterium]|uniref:helix-turn-helix domain-containing protein n=1 Tax=Sphingomonas bacterium TaxID=1895847 RepID=UPI001576ED16|nr:helix-turn-helix transcriptional regulator [Sphingomonas bacterium]